uniref:Ig-like domain-containing protein n=1 Tax=Nothobranchius rachovii TaxID=451742 RepID=A0A1A8RAG7_9TELE
MASHAALYALSVFLFSAGAGVSGFVKITCNDRTVGQIGQPSLLNCVVKPTQDTTDIDIVNVKWKRSGDAESFLNCHQDEGCTGTWPGYRFADFSSEWDSKNMNISLLITNTQVKDETNYTCFVLTDSGHDEVDVDLQVTAKYSLPNVSLVPENKTPNSKEALICKASGGYPKGTIRWFGENNEEWTKSAETEVKTMDNGLFELSSKLVLLNGSTFSKYTCAVFNSRGRQENKGAIQTTDFLVHEPTPVGKTPKVVAGVLVIGSLIVGLLLLLLIRRRRAQPPHHREGPARGSEADPLDSTA